MRDEQQVPPRLIQAWAARRARRRPGHGAGPTTHPASVMFDVFGSAEPRGCAASRPTVTNLARRSSSGRPSGAVFQIESLDVTARRRRPPSPTALLRCGDPRRTLRPAHPGQRLRAHPSGPCRQGRGARWTVTHEHHYFPDLTPLPTRGEPRTDPAGAVMRKKLAGLRPGGRHLSRGRTASARRRPPSQDGVRAVFPGTWRRFP